MVEVAEKNQLLSWRAQLRSLIDGVSGPDDSRQPLDQSGDVSSTVSARAHSRPPALAWSRRITVIREPFGQSGDWAHSSR